jgi:hypothetical protein
MLTEPQKAALAAPLPRDFVKKINGNDYVEGYYVVDRLNEVFGADGWSDEYGELAVRASGTRPVYSVTCALTAGGCVRRNVGVGIAANDKPDAIETAIKAAYTDALKRCAYKLGNSFGLALYEKVTGDQRRRGVGYSTVALAMFDEIDACTTVDAVNAWVKANASRVAALKEDEPDAVKGEVANRRRLCAALVAPTTDAPSGEHRAAPRTEQPLTTGAAQTAAAPAQAAPAWSLHLGAAETRLAVARTVQGIVATLRGAAVPTEERTALWSLALAAAKRINVTEADLTERLTKAASLGATAAQWSTAAQVLIALDTCTSATALDAVRKQYAAAVVALPEALQRGVKLSTTERARELGAPTVAARLLEEIKAVKRADDLTPIYQRLQAAAANSQVSQSEAAAIETAMNERADALTTRAA